MNLVIETIKKRQSIRLYEQKPVSKDIINTIIEAGNLAPSTGEMKLVEEGGKKRKMVNYQPWRFVVVEDPEFKQNLFQTIEPRARIWGFIAAPLFPISWLSLFGSILSGFFLLPLVVNELVLAIWLIVKGFNTSTINTKLANAET
jgi:nitroreductase